MNFNSVLKFFLPKDKVFYALFEQVSNTLEEMAILLRKGVDESNFEKKKEIFRQIADLEHTNDDTTHRIFVELGRNFITPFDREDIHMLASRLDDVADYIHGASKKIILYKVVEKNESISKLSRIIFDSTMEVKMAIHELSSMNNIRIITDACVRINSLENQADDVYEDKIACLFEDNGDVLRVIKLKEILQSLEGATDKCEDVANVLESIIIKYA